MAEKQYTPPEPMAEAGAPDPTDAHPWPNSSTHRQDVQPRPNSSTHRQLIWTPSTLPTQNTNIARNTLKTAFLCVSRDFQQKTFLDKTRATTQWKSWFNTARRYETNFFFFSKSIENGFSLRFTRFSTKNIFGPDHVRRHLAEKQYTPPEPMAEAGAPDPTVAHPWPNSSTHRLDIFYIQPWPNSSTHRLNQRPRPDLSQRLSPL